jgi:type IV pilus assembly protein PilA
MKTQSKKGFTLVEIMIVVVIIGLLAAMAIPAFQKVRETAVGKALTNDARQLASGAQQYMLENGVTQATFTIDVTTGDIDGQLADYVKQVGKQTSGPGTIEQDTDFTMSHPQFEDEAEQTFSAEGQPQ